MQKRNKILGAVTLLLIILILPSSLAVRQLMSFQGQAADSQGNAVNNGNLTVFIYSSASGGAPVYNSSNDFNNTITNGYFDVMLGSGSVELSLNFSQLYYLDASINGEDLDWSGSERMMFEASTGTTINANVTVGSSLFVDVTNNRVGIGTVAPAYLFDVNSLFYVLASGFVGIGKVPNFMLDVSGTVNASEINVSGGITLGGTRRTSWVSDTDTNCTSDGSCPLITYDSEFDNSTIIRNGNTTWVTSTISSSYIDSTEFDNGTIIRNGNVSWIVNTLENGTIIRNTNTTWVTSAVADSYIDTGEMDNGSVVRNHNTTWVAGILDNGTIVRNTNVSWVLAQLTGSNNISIINGVISINASLSSGSSNCSASGSCPSVVYEGDNVNFTNLNASGTVFFGGSVGVGTSAPNMKLTVVGNVNVTGNITSGVGTVFIDGTNSRLGIGTKSPSNALEVVGTMNASSVVVAGNQVLTAVGFSGENITSGTVADARIAATIARDSELDNGSIVRNHNTTWVTSAVADSYIDTGEMDNGSVVRNHNTTWITANAYNEGDNANFTNLNASGTVIFSNGNVGIGTTNPQSILHINSSGANQVRLQSTGNADQNITFYGASNPIGIINNRNDGSKWLLELGTFDDLDTLVIRDSNVGIGTTTPGATLDVKGDMIFNLTSGSKDFNIVNGTGTSRFFVDESAGNVGIGTASPSVPLHIFSSTGSGNRLEVEGVETGVNAGLGMLVTNNGIGGPAYLNLQAGGAANAVGLYAEGSLGTPAGGMTIKVGGPNRIAIKSDGNVGIGTTTPSEKLQVNGNFSANNTLFVTESGRVGIGTTNPGQKLDVEGNIDTNDYDIILGNDGTYNAQFTYDDNFGGSGKAKYGFDVPGLSNPLLYNIDDDLLEIQDSVMVVEGGGNVGIDQTSPGAALHVGASALWVNSTGNVGIGTTSPGSKLTVLQSAVNSGIGINYGSLTGVIQWDANDVLQFGATSNNGIGFVTNGIGDRIRIDTSGNVGIGTTTPGYKLEVNDVGADGLSMNVSNVLFVNQSSGNVGIGTTNPQNKLHVEDGYLEIKSTGSTDYGLRLENDAGTATILGIGDQNDADVPHDFFIQTNAGKSLVIQDSGNVGIGTTTPDMKLTVEGNMNVSQNLSVGGIKIWNNGSGLCFGSC